MGSITMKLAYGAIVILFLVGMVEAKAQPLEACQLKGPNSIYDKAISCRCPAGTVKVDTGLGDPQFGRSQWINKHFDCDPVAKTQETPSKSKTAPGRCGGGKNPQQCVVLEQRGTNGRWHNYRLVNGCNKAFNVNVFSCSAKWAGGCEVASQRVGPCETTGSASEGKQSWDRNAEPRW